MGKKEKEKQIAQTCYITRQANEAICRYHLRNPQFLVRYALFSWYYYFMYEL